MAKKCLLSSFGLNKNGTSVDKKNSSGVFFVCELFKESDTDTEPKKTGEVPCENVGRIVNAEIKAGNANAENKEKPEKKDVDTGDFSFGDAGGEVSDKPEESD